MAEDAVLYGEDRCHALAEEWVICSRVHALANIPCLHMRPAAVCRAKSIHPSFDARLFPLLSRMPLLATITHLLKS